MGELKEQNRGKPYESSWGLHGLTLQYQPNGSDDWGRRNERAPRSGMVLEIREMGGTEDVRCRGEYTTGAARGRIGDNQKRIVHIHLIHIALIFCTNLSCSCSAYKIQAQLVYI